MQLPLFVEHFPIDHPALQRCLRSSVVALDIETQTRWPGQGPRHDYGLSYPAPVVIIGLAWREDDDIYTTALVEPFDESALQFLQQLFQSETTIVAHNAVFDIRQLSKLTHGQIPRHIWDTMIMARLLHPAVRLRYRLLSVAEALGIPVPQQQIDLKGKRGKLHELPRAVALQYAAADAQLALAIYEKQRDLPGDPALIDWECRATYQYCRMAAQGLRLNISYVEQLQAELSQRKTQMASRLAADGLTNPDSPKARVQYLYETKGIPLPAWNPDERHFFTWAGYRRLSEAGYPRVTLDDLSTRASVIEAYVEDGSPYADQLKDLAAYVRTDWLLSILISLGEHAALDGRVHSLTTIATDTGRRSSSQPAMQNWKMPAMAGVVIGDDGFTLVEIDYANAENVMAAMIAGDDNLAATCRTDDFHSTMAVRYFGETWEQATPQERKHLRGLSKRISYGTAYGMGARSLSKSLDVSLAEGHAFLRARDTAFPQLARVRKLAERKVQETASLKLWSGRPVALEQPFVAWNYVCQGGVSEMLKRAIVQISEDYAALGLRSRVALDIHDAIIIEVAHDEWATALDLAAQTMCTIVPLELRQRTSPAIEWLAKPDFVENQNKWGKGQYHPEIDSP
ncbi:DNA polymerase [Chloroflexota bacterium]